jgi:hypothetical protein
LRITRSLPAVARTTAPNPSLELFSPGF